MSPSNDKPGKRRLNPRKLLLSKWTAAQPQNRERHFLVTELIRDEADNILGVELQAVLTQRSQQLDWRQLQDTERSRRGAIFVWRRSPAHTKQYESYTKHLTCTTAHL